MWGLYMTNSIVKGRPEMAKNTATHQTLHSSKKSARDGLNFSTIYFLWHNVTRRYVTSYLIILKPSGAEGRIF